jgi:hypothetical protein
MLTPERMREYASTPHPIVCVQIRLGDFHALAPGETFGRVGNTRTPTSYFAGVIDDLRELHGSELPVTIFTDGTKEQLRDLLAIPGVKLGPHRSKIVDLLSMAASKVLVPSAGSTFGYWAGFLSDCALLIHLNHVHQSIRPDEINTKYFEGPVTGSIYDWPDLLRRNVLAISRRV